MIDLYYEILSKINTKRDCGYEIYEKMELKKLHNKSKDIVVSMSIF